MKTRSWIVLAALLASQSDVYGLTPTSSTDGPVKLLACVVTPTRVLEAAVESQSDDTMNCNIRCNYELGEKMFSHSFNVTIPARFSGRVGEFDTSNAKPGNYTGDIGTCEKVSR